MSEVESRRIFQMRFNALLAERSVSQKEIAAICEVSTSTVSTWSKGLNMPRMDKIERLANHFGLPKSYFIEAELSTPAEPVIENPDIRMIARAGKKMSPDQAAAARKVIEALFPEAFKEDD